MYKGGLKNQVRHGQGTFVYPNHFFSYSGDWENGLKHGIGRFVSGDTIYEGDFVNGEIEGLGKKTWKDGKVYEGNFHAGGLHGYGVLKFSNGDVYTGDFIRNKYHGNGELVTRDFWYAGEFQSHKWHGKGEVEYKDGRKYSGDFVEGHQHGWGKLITKDFEYDGEFVWGKKEGSGVLSNNLTGITYQGLFKADSQVITPQKLYISSPPLTYHAIATNTMTNNANNAINQPSSQNSLPLLNSTNSLIDRSSNATPVPHNNITFVTQYLEVEIGKLLPNIVVECQIDNPESITTNNNNNNVNNENKAETNTNIEILPIQMSPKETKNLVNNINDLMESTSSQTFNNTNSSNPINTGPRRKKATKMNSLNSITSGLNNMAENLPPPNLPKKGILITEESGRTIVLKITFVSPLFVEEKNFEVPRLPPVSYSPTPQNLKTPKAPRSKSIHSTHVHPQTVNNNNTNSSNPNNIHNNHNVSNPINININNSNNNNNQSPVTSPPLSATSNTQNNNANNSNTNTTIMPSNTNTNPQLTVSPLPLIQNPNLLPIDFQTRSRSLSHRKTSNYGKYVSKQKGDDSENIDMLSPRPFASLQVPPILSSDQPLSPSLSHLFLHHGSLVSEIVLTTRDGLVEFSGLSLSPDQECGDYLLTLEDITPNTPHHCEPTNINLRVLMSVPSLLLPTNSTSNVNNNTNNHEKVENKSTYNAASSSPNLPPVS